MALPSACPIVGSYGGKDRSLRGAAGRLDRALTAAGVEHDVKEYPGAGRMFLNDYKVRATRRRPCSRSQEKLTPGMGCHEESAQDARRQIIAFCDAHLKTWHRPLHRNAVFSAADALTDRPRRVPRPDVRDEHARTFGIRAPGHRPGRKGPTPLSASRGAARLLVTGAVSSRGRWAMTYSPAGSRIVVGVDGSAASDAAVRWAVREALLRHATVHLVSAYHSDSRQRAQYVPSSWEAPQEEHSAAAEALVAATMELARRSLPPGRLTAELANEPPARALLARAAHAELLVLGTTRPAPRPGQPPQAMGPVARACLQLAHCPVVVVSADDRSVRDLTAGQGEQDAASRQAARGSSAGT